MILPFGISIDDKAFEELIECKTKDLKNQISDLEKALLENNKRLVKLEDILRNSEK